MCFLFILIASLFTFHSGVALDLSSAFSNVPYDNFQVRVYKDIHPYGPYSTTGDSYYYAPACVFVPNSTYIVSNAEQRQNFVVFSIKLWDDDYQAKIETEALKKFSLTGINLRMIPFHSLRLELIDSSLPISIANNWIPIPHQPSTILARIPCVTGRECDSIKDSLQSPKDQLLFGMEVIFKLDKPVKTKRALTFETSSFQTSSIFSLIEQQFTQNSTVCLDHLDLQRMVREVLENVMESSIPDEEFIAEDQLYLTIKRAIRMLKPNITSSEDFSQDDWNSVFWSVDTDRPDEKVNLLNDLISNGSEWTKPFLPIGSNFTELNIANPNQNNQTQIRWKSLLNQLRDVNGMVEWKGDEFVIKPMTLYCVNLTALRHSTVLGSINVWTSGRTGDLTSAINVPHSTAREGDSRRLMKIYERLEQTENELRSQFPIGSIIALYQNGSLAKCWLHCDGRSFSTSAYPLLAKVMHPHTTTPDLQGRVLVGVGADYSSRIGETGGEATHQLTLDEIPPHTHNLTLLSEVHGGPTVPSYRRDSERSDGVRMATSTSGGGKGHNNLPPFTTAAFLIRAC